LLDLYAVFRWAFVQEKLSENAKMGVAFELLADHDDDVFGLALNDTAAGAAAGVRQAAAVQRVFFIDEWNSPLA
jgi:hypothetical protein